MQIQQQTYTVKATNTEPKKKHEQGRDFSAGEEEYFKQSKYSISIPEELPEDTICNIYRVAQESVQCLLNYRPLWELCW